jgi:hypothetical protein
MIGVAMFQGHFHEELPPSMTRLFARRDVSDLKIELWNAFADAGLLGICDHDCSVLPRFLPASMLPMLRTVCRDLCECLLKILSLPARELRAIIPTTPIVDFLVEELGVLKHRPRRLTGSFRFDMAIEGAPQADNPPKLLEVNEIGFDGVGRSSFIQETMFALVPELRERVIALDTAASEVRNMRRLGPRFARLQYDAYNWEEEVLRAKGERIGLAMRFVTPDAFGVKPDPDCRLLTRERVRLRDGRIVIGKDRISPDAVQVSYSFELKDYQEAPSLFADIVCAETPQYSPFLTGLVAPKTILAVLGDRKLVERLLGRTRAARLARSILPARLLGDDVTRARHRADHLVLKRGDGMGGEYVWIGKKLRPVLARIPRSDRAQWVLQQRIRLNTLTADGILSRSRRVVADLGAFVQYDWEGGRFRHFSLGGFITRATNHGLKVNVSGGGAQVPVMFDRTR